MATITARRTMGQAGQGTLLPFFGKQPEKAARQPSGPASSATRELSNDDAHLVTNPPGQTVSLLSSDMEVVQEVAGERDTDHYEGPDAGRRKRRKTESPRVRDSKVKGTDARQGDTSAQTDLQTSVPSVGNEQQQASPAQTDLVPSTTPKRKVLRLNPNGKLLSSPVRGTSEDEQTTSAGRRRSVRGKTKPAQKTATRSAIVVMRYGKDATTRQATGSQINEILEGGKRSIIPEPSARAPSPSRGPPKPLHPFFLGKKPESKASNTEQTAAQPIQPVQKTMQSPAPPLTNTNSRGVPDLPKPPSRPKLPTEALDPIWPPRDLVHIRGRSTDQQERRPSAPLLVSNQRRKAKGSLLGVPASESVLSKPPIPCAGTAEIDTPDISLRTPHRGTCTGNELRELTLGKLSPDRAPASRAPGHGYHARNKTHPAVSALVSSLPEARSSLDRGVYDDISWVQKYAPKTAERVLQVGPEALMLRSWLQKNEITAVSTGHNTGLDSKSGTKRKKRHKKPKDLEGFLVSSGDEESEMHELPGSEDEDDELAGGVTISHRRTMVRSVDGLHSSKQGVTNAVLLSGPPGCGKTAAVYAAAKELGFEIFEVNPGSRRSGRDLLERVGDMTQNHLVHLLKTLDNGPAAGARTEPAASKPEPAPSGQNTMNSFFKQKSRAPTSKKASSGAEKEVKPASGKKQSLILLEEVDVLFEEDKSFWSGVIALMSQSKRPIVLTCNDESRLPLDDLSLHAIFRFRPPPLDLAVDYMLLLAANEGHALDRQPITDLYIVLQRDLRKTIAQLDFWCQMAVGSRRCGVDWLVNRPPPPGPGDPASFPRTVSSGTYMQGMGWFSSDIFVLEHDHYEKRSQLMMDCLDQWHIGLMDWHENKQGQTYPDMFSRLDALAQEEDIADVRSALDVLCRESWSTPNTDILDPSSPAMTDRERDNYVTGYPILQTTRTPDYTCLSRRMGAAISVLLEDCLETFSSLDDEQSIVRNIQKSSAPRRASLGQVEFQAPFEPLLDADSHANAPPGQALSFAHPIGVIATDVAPYVRAIVSYDLQLEQRRLELSRLLGQEGRGSKRMRTTRAGRAALEGGSKATTRRERWFPVRLNVVQVLATGGKHWQKLCSSRESAQVSGGSEVSHGDGASSATMMSSEEEI